MSAAEKTGASGTAAGSPVPTTQKPATAAGDEPPKKPAVPQVLPLVKGMDAKLKTMDDKLKAVDEKLKSIDERTRTMSERRAAAESNPAPPPAVNQEQQRHSGMVELSQHQQVPETGIRWFSNWIVFGAMSLGVFLLYRLWSRQRQVAETTMHVKIEVRRVAERLDEVVKGLARRVDAPIGTRGPQLGFQDVLRELGAIKDQLGNLHSTKPPPGTAETSKAVKKSGESDSQGNVDDVPRRAAAPDSAGKTPLQYPDQWANLFQLDVLSNFEAPQQQVEVHNPLARNYEFVGYCLDGTTSNDGWQVVLIRHRTAEPDVYYGYVWLWRAEPKPMNASLGKIFSGPRDQELIYRNVKPARFKRNGARFEVSEKGIVS